MDDLPHWIPATLKLYNIERGQEDIVKHYKHGWKRVLTTALHCSMLVIVGNVFAEDNASLLPVSAAPNMAATKPALPPTSSLRREVLSAYVSQKGVIAHETDIDLIVKKYITPDLLLENAKHVLESAGFTVVQVDIPARERSKYKVRMVGCICNVDARPYMNADIMVVIESNAGKASTVKGRIVVEDF